MEEKKLVINKILNTLSKKSFIEIQPICADCAGEIVKIVLDAFNTSHFDVYQIGDELYCLRISI